MLGFDYDKFKAAIEAAKIQKHEELKKDIEKTKLCIEKILTLAFESSASKARASYQGIDL